MINTIVSLEMSKEKIMERMTINAFKEQSYIEIIESIMKINTGYVTSKELSNLGIHRMSLNIMKAKVINFEDAIKAIKLICEIVKY